MDTGSDGHVKITTEGSERLRITSDGRVGIATLSPEDVDLDVVRRVTVSDASIRLYNGLTGSGNHTKMRYKVQGTLASNYIFFGDGGSDNAGQIRYQHSDDSLQINTAGSERLRITSTGLVGIGSDAPTLGLDIDKGANSGLFLGNPTHGYKIRANVTSSNDYGLLIEDEDGVDLYRATSSTGTTD